MLLTLEGTSAPDLSQGRGFLPPCLENGNLLQFLPLPALPVMLLCELAELLRTSQELQPSPMWKTYVCFSNGMGVLWPLGQYLSSQNGG